MADTIDAPTDVPLVLLPVRIETRFTADGSALRVRIWPDDLHVDPLGPGLREGEREPAENYWFAVWLDDAAHEAAWAGLVQAVGARRAAWVAEQMKPINWADRPNAATEFPDIEPATSTGPQVRSLPSHFVVQIEQGDEVRRVPGEAIPDVVSTALLAEGLPSPADLAAGKTPIPAAALWMADYPDAERAGMAVTVPLPVSNQRIDRLIVSGVKQLDPREGATLLKELLRAHRFASDGAFVKIGTPTNNTDTARAGWGRHSAPAERPLEPVPPPPDSDGAIAAEALGVEPAAFADWPNGDGRSQQRARAFVAALFGTTLDAFLRDRLRTPSLGGSVDPGSLVSIRRHAIAHLRARGPLPPLRIGKQPYGLLPVTNGEALEELRPFWRAGVDDVPTVMAGDLEGQLPDLLGTSPVSSGVRVRTVAEASRSFGLGIGLPFIDDDSRLQRRINTLAFDLVGINPSNVKVDGMLGKADRQLAVPMVHASDQEFVRALAQRMDGDPAELPDPASLLQILLAHAVAHLDDQAESIISARDIPELSGHLLGLAEGEGLDVAVIRDALNEVSDGNRSSGAVVAAADHIADRLGVPDVDAIHDRPIVPPDEPTSALSIVLGMSGHSQLIRNEREALQVLGSWFAAARVRSEVREALDEIAAIDDEEDRRIHLAEYLDVCSHRLDAWMTSIATSQLARREPGTGPGLVIGAYGYVEAIEPASPVPADPPPGLEDVDLLRERHPGGYVHAPSTAHASTAAILRAGRLSHFSGDANSATLDIDLSSARVRLATHLIAGVRRGQPLGALLGYRLERRLHETNLDRYIYVLRGLAPLLDAKLTERAVAEEAIAAANVVDGLLLHELDWAATVAPGLVAGPKDTRYLPNGQWPPPGERELEAVKKHIERMSEDLDAVADVLLAESVHQLVGGNMARAAAALDSLGGGEAVPPDPDVIRTPRSGTAIRHQVVVTVPDPAGGWNTTTSARALADPALESWAADQLGGPTSWSVGGSTLAVTGLGALDVVYESDGESLEQSTLGWRLRPQFDPAVDLPGLSRLWELANALRAVLISSATFKIGIDATTLRARAGDALGRLTTALAGLGGASEAIIISTLAGHGVPLGTVPAPDAPPEVLSAISAAMVTEAERRIAVATSQLGAADAAAGTADAIQTTIVERSLDALHTVLGEGFCVVAPTRAVLTVEGGEQASPFDPTAVGDGGDIRPWLARGATVRGALARYCHSLVVREALGGRRRKLRAAQHGWAPWVGAEFPADIAPPTGPVHHIVVESVDGSMPAGLVQISAFVVDSWIEVAPRRVARYDTDDTGNPVLRDIATPATTGLAVGANGPNARAPQAVLVAAARDIERWTEVTVFAVIADTISLAKERAVTLERLPWAGRILPALYFRDWSLQGRPVIDFQRLASVLFNSNAVAKFVKE